MCPSAGRSRWRRRTEQHKGCATRSRTRESMGLSHKSTATSYKHGEAAAAIVEAPRELRVEERIPE